MTTNTAATDEPSRQPQKSMDDYRRQPYLSIGDLADILHRSIDGVRKMRALGHLPAASRTGNRLLWHSGRFFAWIESCQEPDDYDPGPPPRR